MANPFYCDEIQGKRPKPHKAAFAFGRITNDCAGILANGDAPMRIFFPGFLPICLLVPSITDYPLRLCDIREERLSISDDCR